MTESQKIAKRVKVLMQDPVAFLQYAAYTQDEADKKHFGAKQFPYKEKTYLQDLAQIWQYARKNEKDIVIEKSRQMMATWTFGILHLHYAMTVPNRKILILSDTENKAILLLDRLTYVLENMPEDVWPKDLRPKFERRKTRLSFPEMDSHIYSLTSSADASRSITPSAVLIDEFAFMQEGEDIYRSIVGSTSGGAPVTIISTNPKLTDSDSCLFWDLVDDTVDGKMPQQSPINEIVLRTPKGFRLNYNNINQFISIGLHFTADPLKDPDQTEEGKQWYTKTKAKSPGSSFDIEYNMSRKTFGGEGVFADDFNPELHIFDEPFKPVKGVPILRGWDFGTNHSVVFAQYLDGIFYMFDEKPNFSKNTRDATVLLRDYCSQTYPGHEFLDIIDPTGFDKGRNDQTGDSNVDIMVSKGIPRDRIIKAVTNKIEPRLDAVFNLLSSNVKGKPKFQIFKDCHFSIKALKGAYKFSERLTENLNSKIVKDKWSHSMDALQYLALFCTSGHSVAWFNRLRRQASGRRIQRAQPTIYKL